MGPQPNFNQGKMPQLSYNKREKLLKRNQLPEHMRYNHNRSWPRELVIDPYPFVFVKELENGLGRYTINTVGMNLYGTPTVVEIDKDGYPQNTLSDEK